MRIKFLLHLSLIAYASAIFKTPCGGENQRACCIFERFPSCNSGFFEDFGACATNWGFLSFILRYWKCYCAGPIPPIFSDGICKKPDCGQEGERACCLLERFPPCDAGLREVIIPTCGAVLGPPACECLIGGSATGVCRV